MAYESNLSIDFGSDLPRELIKLARSILTHGMTPTNQRRMDNLTGNQAAIVEAIIDKPSEPVADSIDPSLRSASARATIVKWRKSIAASLGL